MNSLGLGSTDGNYAEKGIDLNEQLIRNKQTTFFMRVNSDAMVGEGIHRGDVVIVDRSLIPKNGKIVIAVIDGELLIRRLEILEGRQRLVASKKIASIDVTNQQLNIWGVVTYIIHNV